METYKKKKIESYDSLKKIKEYSEVFMKIHNNIRKDKYVIILGISKGTFDNMNKMIFNYII